MFSIQPKGNIDTIIETGLLLFQIEGYWDKPMSYFFFFNSIPEQYRKYIDQSITLLKLRNTLIVLGYLEMGSALLGSSYYFISKNEMHIFISLCAFVLSIAGVAFFSFINELGIIFYSLITICIPGLLFIHQLFNAALDSNNVSLFGLFTIPYVFDMLCGFIALFYLRKISETNKEIMRLEIVKDEEKQLLDNNNSNGSHKRSYSRDYLKSEFNKRNSMKANSIEEGQINLLCIICCERFRQVLCEPCRHLLMCGQCMSRMSKLNTDLTCPNCNRAIDSFSKIYI